MIKLFKIVLLFILIFDLQAQNNFESAIFEQKKDAKNEIIKIDFRDTVFFNLNKSTRIDPNYIDIPISIKSDDDINAMDFSLRFDQTHLKFNSVVNHTSYMSISDYFNATDATLRLSSNSLTRFDKDTVKLLSLRFEIFTDKLAISDFNQIMTYLNGEPCSFFVIDPSQSTATKGIANNSSVKMYPNPIIGFVNIDVPERSEMKLFDLHGKLLFTKEDLNSNQINCVNFSDIKNGIYYIKIYNELGTYTEKVILK